MRLIANIVKWAVLQIGLISIGQKTFAQTDCQTPATITHMLTNNSITINAGEVYGLLSGSWSGGIDIKAGGTLYIAAGATATVNYITGSNINGTIINKGTLSIPLWGGPHYVTIKNCGTFNSPGIQGYIGNITNETTGTFTVSGLETSNSGNSTITNKGKFVANTITCYNTTVHNYDSLVITNGVNINSGYWNNHQAKLYFKGSNVNISANIDNSGYLELDRISAISSIFNNYGYVKVSNAVNNISSTTNLTNDSLIEFINVSDIQFNGAFLTNNGRIKITHGSAGNFKMNTANAKVHNNGIITATGQLEMNAAGSLILNNCRIVAKNFIIGNGEFRNSGLAWATGNASSDGLNINGVSSYWKGSENSFFRGANFTNTGAVSGYGSFYFTNNTNASSGSIIGSSASSPIRFYDVTRASGLFDQISSATITNVIRPNSMVIMDTTSFDCNGIPSSAAGFPPNTNAVTKSSCNTMPIQINLSSYVTPLDNTYTIDYSTVRLFEYANNANLTNNTTNLNIPNKGLFTANPNNGIITFSPNTAFTTGSVTAEYKIANTRPGDPTVYQSVRTKITITIGSSITPPTISVTTY